MNSSRGGFHQLWPSLMLERTIPGSEPANAALAALIIELDSREDQLTSDYQSQNFFALEHPATQWLAQCMNKTITDYLTEAGLDRSVEWSLQGWANVNRNGDYHGLHNHPHSYLSGTYYVSVPAQTTTSRQRSDLNPGAISFFDPRPQANMNAIAGDPQVDPEFRVLPTAGTVLLWPSFLHHAVHPNFSEQPRLSVSFNAVLKWRDDYVPVQ